MFRPGPNQSSTYPFFLPREILLLPVQARRAVQAQSVQTDVISYNAEITSSEGVRWEQVPPLLERLRLKDLEATLITLNSAMSACEKSDQWEEALPILQQTRDCLLQSTIVTYGCAISACETGSRWENALPFLQEFQDKMGHPNPITFNAVISSCGKGEQWQLALGLCKQMQFLQLCPSHVTVNAAITALAKGGRWQEILQLLVTGQGHLPRFKDLQKTVIRYGGAITASMSLV